MEWGVLQKEPQESLRKPSFSHRGKVVARGIQTLTSGWHCGCFQEAAQQLGKSNFPAAITAALQTLQGTLENVNPQTVGKRELEAGVQIFTTEARPGGRQGPGEGPKRNDRQAAGGWRPSRGGQELCLPRAFQGFLWLSRAFSAAPGSRRWFFSTRFNCGNRRRAAGERWWGAGLSG